jgi:hypothetical protein
MAQLNTPEFARALDAAKTQAGNGHKLTCYGPLPMTTWISMGSGLVHLATFPSPDSEIF